MKRAIPILAFMAVTIWVAKVDAWVDANQFGLGLRFGTNRLEGDWAKPKLNPYALGQIKYYFSPYVGLGLEAGYSELKSRIDFQALPIDSVIEADKFKTHIVPIEADITFNFLPLGKVNPFFVIGGGGALWESKINKETFDRRLDSLNIDEQKGLDSFIKVGAGLEFRLSRSFTASIGTAYRYSLTDMLDQVFKGDLNDGILDAYVGLTYYIRLGISDDADSDGIIDILDLDSQQPEDADGFMDHDGMPEKGPDLRPFEQIDALTIGEDNNDVPVVIHYPVYVAESGRDLKLQAKIYKNGGLRAALVLFRITGKHDWKSRKLLLVEGNRYEAIIPGKYLSDRGLEYCIVAVDEAVSGVGYSGLPKRPIRIKGVPSGRGWRILSGAVGVIGWGIATFLLTKKQID